MGSSYYNAIASSLTAEDQARLIAELSTDGTLEGVDLSLLQQKIAENPNDEDYAYLYTYLTGSLSSNWDADLVDPDMVDDLEEWANLTTSADLAADIQEFISLIGVEAGLSTALGGSLGMQATVEEIVTYANDYYATTEAAQAEVARDYEGMISLALEMGSVRMALMYILAGYTDPVTGEHDDGLLASVGEAESSVVEKFEEVQENILERGDEREMLDPTEDSAQLTELSNLDNFDQQSLSLMTSNLTTLQGVISDSINALVKISEMETATAQRIWS